MNNRGVFKTNGKTNIIHKIHHPSLFCLGWVISKYSPTVSSQTVRYVSSHVILEVSDGCEQLAVNNTSPPVVCLHQLVPDLHVWQTYIAHNEVAIIVSRKAPGDLTIVNQALVKSAIPVNRQPVGNHTRWPIHTINVSRQSDNVQSYPQFLTAVGLFWLM